VEGRGATLIAISPQAPEARIRCDAPEPPFPLLFDSEAKVARRCGIAFTLSEELRPIYAGAGRRPPSEGRDNWLLPLPASYVVDWTGEIVFSYLDTDYTSRLEPADIITILAHLAGRTERERPQWVERAKPKGVTQGRGSAKHRIIQPSPTRTS
jgi:peroxiredoxin